ncbi:MAG: ComF family protein [Gammaproteobacteria bacterium]|nr:ComF family protein [Gammaproteobacteria bacterium]
MKHILPGACLLCGVRCQGGSGLCPGCAADLPRLPATRCRVCAAPLPHAGVCGVCQQRPPAYDRCVAALEYRFPADQLIQQLKFQRRLVVAEALGELLADTVAGQYRTLPDCVLPVPLHRARLRERGFNQALELARPLLRRFGIVPDLEGCSRVRATTEQAGLPAALRQHNLRRAFKVHRSYRGRHVAIIDDVMTTGHTVNELARVLRAAGAQRIDVWVAARTVLRPGDEKTYHVATRQLPTVADSDRGA